MERRENDKLLPEHAKDASYPEDWWLDEADSADGLPVLPWMKQKILSRTDSV